MIVTVAAPTNGLDTSRSSSPSMARTGRQVVILGGRQQIATLSTPLSVPVIAAARLRRGSTNSMRGAASLLAEALATAGRAGAGTARHALLLVRADSAFYGYDIISACRRAGARFSVTARMTATMTRAIATIDEGAWTPIRYRNAL